MVIGAKCVVTLCYRLSVLEPDGSTQLLEARTDQNPIEFIYGQGMVLPAVERHIEKKSQGHKAVLVLPPNDAFGEVIPALETWYELSKLPKGLPIQPGLKFQTQGPDGEVISVLVKEVRDGQVLLDGNHPLAGATIEFELEIMRVRAASEEELASGQVQNRLH